MAKRTRIKTAVRRRGSTELSNKIISRIAGVASVALGIFGIFTDINTISTLALIAGSFIIGLSVLDFVSIFRDNKAGGKFAFSLIKAGSELLIGILAIVNHDHGMTWPLTLLSVYMLGQGVLQILTALAFIKNKTERFFWVICGAIGCILGIIALNSGGLADVTTFFRLFAIYMAIYGVTTIVSLVYSNNKK